TASTGARSIKICELALARDPLSSSGVQKAINTALAGAVSVNTLLRYPERADAAKRFYTGNLSETSDRHRRWAAHHYAVAAATRPARFWQTRAADAAAEPERIPPSEGFGIPDHLAVALSPDAMLMPEPCIVGDFIAIKPALHHPDLERPVAFLGGSGVGGCLRRRLGGG